MKTFAVSMAFLLALLVGGGYYAYEVGLSVHGQADAHGVEAGHAEEGDHAEEEAIEGEDAVVQPGAGVSDEAEGEPLVVDEQREDEESARTEGVGEGEVSGGEAQAQAASLVGVADQGQTIFAATCAGCHGQNAEGSVGPSLVGRGAAATWQFADFHQAVLMGEAPGEGELSAVMPRYATTAIQPKGEPASDQDVADIQAYLQSLN